jgi:hypothetical protein
MPKFSDAEIDWAIGQVSLLESLPGFPKTEQSLSAVAQSYLRIVKDHPAIEWEIDDRRKGHRDAVSKEESSEQLIAELLASFERFPAPIRMREVYERLGYGCADGKTIGELLPEPRSY